METGSRKIFFLSFFTTMLIMAIVYYSFYTGRNIVERFTPLVDAVKEVKLETTIAHLWFEEAISGDNTLKIEDIWHHLDNAEWYARAILDGGTNEEDTILALNDPSLRLKINATIAGIHQFRSIAQKRWASQTTSGIGSNLDQEFDQSFINFSLSADDVERALQKIISQNLDAFKFTQRLLLVIILLLGALLAVR